MPSSTKISIYLGSDEDAVKLEAVLKVKAKNEGLSLSEYVVKILRAEAL